MSFHSMAPKCSTFIDALALAMSSGRWVIHDDSLSLPVAEVFGVSSEVVDIQRNRGRYQDVRLSL